MGRLTKANMDKIVRLREEGYTQKEIAQKIGVHVRTVRKYDPLHQSGPHGERSVEDRLAALEEAVRASWDWIDLLHAAMLGSPDFGDMLDVQTYSCPRCDGKLRYDDDVYHTYVCYSCGHKFSQSMHWCYHCLSQQEMHYVKATDEWVCRKCGACRYSR